MIWSLPCPYNASLSKNHCGGAVSAFSSGLTVPDLSLSLGNCVAFLGKLLLISQKKKPTKIYPDCYSFVVRNFNISL